jgi:mono/diheme cytochrome c family protein
MIVSKTPKVLFMFVVLALAGALVVAGCGGSGGTTTSGSTATGEEPNVPAETEEAPAEEKEEEPAEETEEAPAEEEPAEEKEAGGESAALSEEGKVVFTTNCGSCHTLKEAGTSGEIGPNLDELEPDLATVEHQVINGGGPMPAFGKEGILNSKEVKAVATYVSSVAGTE